MSYLRYDEIASGVRTLADTYGDHCRLVELPDPSVEGRPILALELGDASGSERRTTIYVGGVHAREWIPPEALLYLCADLLRRGRRRRADLRRGTDQRRRDPPHLRRAAARRAALRQPGRAHLQPEVDPDWRKNRATSGSAAASVSTSTATSTRRGTSAGTFAPDSVSASDDPCAQVRLRRAGGRVGAGDAQHRLAARALSRGRNGSSTSTARCRRSSTTGGSTRTRTTIPTQNFLNPAFDGQRGVAGDAAIASTSTPRTVWSCGSAVELMAIAIRKVRERRLSRLGRPSRSTPPPARATTMPTAATAPTHRCPRCSASPSSAGTTSSQMDGGRGGHPRGVGRPGALRRRRRSEGGRHSAKPSPETLRWSSLCEAKPAVFGAKVAGVPTGCPCRRGRLFACISGDAVGEP